MFCTCCVDADNDDDDDVPDGNAGGIGSGHKKSRVGCCSAWDRVAEQDVNQREFVSAGAASGLSVSLV